VKLAVFTCLVGLVAGVVGVCDDAVLPRFDRLRLDHELSKAEARGHPAVLLVERVDTAELGRRATARSSRGRCTVLALGDLDAQVVPSAVDASIADARAWTRVARNATAGFLAVGDMRGAAGALVRLYSRELAARGIVPRLPPGAPILLPDVKPPVPRPSDVGWMGVGLMLFVMGLGRWMRVRWDNGSGRRELSRPD
jgi:hypothetical protein